MSTKPPNARVKLTKTSVAQLEAPETGQRFVRDTDLKGFGVRITPTGRKSFILEKRVNRRVRRITIGRDGEVTVAQARNRAQQLLGQIAMGEDPVANKRREHARGVRLLEAYEDFLKARPRLRPATRVDYDRAIYVVFKDWQQRPLHTLTGQMMIHRHRALAKTRGEQGANNYMRVLRAIYTFAMDRYEDGSGQPVIARNPVLILTRTRSWFPVDRRRTIVKPSQLHDWYEAVQSLRDNEHHRAMGDIVADFLLLLLFTGLRRNEAATLKWADVDLQESALTVSNTKSHRPHTLPFSTFVHTLFLRRLGARHNEYVFPGHNGVRHLVEPKRQVQQVIKQSGIKFTMHDLRRTFLTIADSLELSPYTIKRLANHSTRGDVTAGYIISDLERLRTPMDRIEKFILSAINNPESEKIIPIRFKPNSKLKGAEN